MCTVEKSEVRSSAKSGFPPAAQATTNVLDLLLFNCYMYSIQSLNDYLKGIFPAEFHSFYVIPDSIS